MSCGPCHFTTSFFAVSPYSIYWSLYVFLSFFLSLLFLAASVLCIFLSLSHFKFICLPMLIYQSVYLAVYFISCLFFSCPSLCPFYTFRTFSSVIFSLFLDSLLYLCLCLFLLSFPSRFISPALPLLTKLYAAICWLRIPSHSLPLKMHYCVTELNWYCPGLFVHNIVFEFEF